MYNPLGKCRVVITHPHRTTAFLATEPTGCKGLVCGMGKTPHGPIAVFLDDVGNLECYFNGARTENFTIVGLK